MSQPKAQPVKRALDDTGATFIELLVSVVLLGTAGIAILAATTTAIIGARTSDEIAKSQGVIAEAADFLTDTDPEGVTYRDCVSFTPASEYQSELDARFGAGVVLVERVDFWNRNTGAFGTNCRFNQGDRLQHVTLRSLINERDRSIVAVKRPVDIPTIDVGTPDTPPPYTGGSGQASVNLNPDINGGTP